MGVRSSVFRNVLEALANDLRARGDPDLSESFIDGTFVAAKNGGVRLELPSGGGQGYEDHGNIRRQWSS